MNVEMHKPVVGFSCGDINGIGIELIIKSLSDSRITDVCIPVVFASNKSINFYRKVLPDIREMDVSSNKSLFTARTPTFIANFFEKKISASVNAAAIFEL